MTWAEKHVCIHEEKVHWFICHSVLMRKWWEWEKPCYTCIVQCKPDNFPSTSPSIKSHRRRQEMPALCLHGWTQYADVTQAFQWLRELEGHGGQSVSLAACLSTSAGWSLGSKPHQSSSYKTLLFDEKAEPDDYNYSVIDQFDSLNKESQGCKYYRNSGEVFQLRCNVLFPPHTLSLSCWRLSRVYYILT